MKQEIKMVKPDELIPYENNPRDNDNAVEAVANSIKEFGFKQPIVVDKNMVIIVGHTRLKASQKLGLEEVPVLVAEDLTAEQVRAYRLADNKTGDIASWDLSKLYLELEELEDEIDMSLFNFDIWEEEFNLDDLYEENYKEYNEALNKDSYLKWGGKKVEISDDEIEFLDYCLSEYNATEQLGFVAFLKDTEREQA